MYVAAKDPIDVRWPRNATTFVRSGGSGSTSMLKPFATARLAGKRPLFPRRLFDRYSTSSVGGGGAPPPPDPEPSPEPEPEEGGEQSVEVLTELSVVATRARIHTVAPMAAAGREFLYPIAGTPTRVSLYNPGTESLTVSHYIDGTGAGGVAIGSIVVPPRMVRTYAYAPANVALPRRDFFRVTSGAGIVVLARRKETFYDFETVYPASPVNYMYDLGTGPLLVDIRNRGTPTVTKNAHCLFSVDLTTPCAAYYPTDGAGGGGISSKPSSLLRNSYVIGHALRDYQIVAPNPDTAVLIRYLDVNARVWRNYATRTLNPTSIYTPVAYAEGDAKGVAGSGMGGGAAIWLFTSSQPFLLRTNDRSGFDEYYPTGWNAADLVTPFSSKLGKYFPRPVYPDAFYNKIGAPMNTEGGDYYYLTRLYKAWGYSQGTGVVLGMIDNGVDLTHREFVGRLQVNANEIAGNKVDDDNNGYVDDIYGVRTVTSFKDNVLTDETGHGTQVASILVGNGNRVTTYNSRPFYGTAPKSTLIIVKSNSDGPKSPTDVYEGLAYLYSRGVRIVSLQSGMSASNNLATRMMNDYPQMLLVVAAGNSGKEITDGDPYFPASAARTAPNIISVGAGSRTYSADYYTVYYDRLPFSNYAKATHRSVTLFAPGGSLLLGQKGGAYGLGSGTSFAAPYTAGVAALMKSYYPDITAAEMKYLLIEGCIPMVDGELYSVAGGGLDAGKSLSLLRTKLVNNIPLTTKLPAGIQLENWLNLDQNDFSANLNPPPIYVYPE